MEKDKEKKQVLLRISSSLWGELVAWSENDFRSLNGQIEYLLSECVKRRKKEKIQENGESQEQSFGLETDKKSC